MEIGKSIKVCHTVAGTVRCWAYVGVQKKRAGNAMKDACSLTLNWKESMKDFQRDVGAVDT